MTQRTYSREEMEEILRRAAEHSTLRSDEASAIRYEDLVAAAGEVGIDAATVERVAKDIESGRAKLVAAREEDAIVREHMLERRHGARQSAVHFAVVTTFLLLLDFFTPGGPWAPIVAIVWGLFVALRFARAWMAPSPSQRERILRRERRRRAKAERKQQREQAARAIKDRLHAQQQRIAAELEERKRRSADREQAARAFERSVEQAGREFERSVEQGVIALLQVVARRVEEATREATGEVPRRSSTPRSSAPAAAPSGEFGKYVERQKQGTSAPSPGPRIRVATPDPTPPRTSSTQRAAAPEAADRPGVPMDDDEIEEAARRRSRIAR